MIFLRNNNSIVGIISKSRLGILNPLQWSGKLEVDALLMTKAFSNDGLYYAFPTDEAYGYGYPPEKYYIRTCSGVYDADGNPFQYGIYLYIDHSQDVIWYDGYNQTGNVIHIEVSEESMVLVKILGNRLVYNDGNNEIIIKDCLGEPKTSSAVAICFYDKYGLPQMGMFPVGDYNFSSAFSDEFESVNYGIKYYSTIKPYALIGIGEECIQENYRNYYEGLCVNNPIYVVSKDKSKCVVGSVYDSSITANYYGKNLAFAGTLNLTCHDDYDSIIFR